MIQDQEQVAGVSPDMLAIIEQASQAADSYYNNDILLITDEEYDALIQMIEEAVAKEPALNDNPKVMALLHKVAAGTSRSGSVAHATPMLSLRKVRESDELERIIAGYGKDTVISVEPKIDGIALVVQYIDGKRGEIATRGDGSLGESITKNLAGIPITGLPLELNEPITCEVRGEIHMSSEDFVFSNNERIKYYRGLVIAANEKRKESVTSFNDAQEARRVEGKKSAPKREYVAREFDEEKVRYANERNAASGAVFRETHEYPVTLSFGCYDFSYENEPDSYTERINRAQALGINTVQHLVQDLLANTSTTLEAIQIIGTTRASGKLGFPTDGAVIKVDSSKVREVLGAGNTHPNWAVAFKYPAIQAETTVLDIERAIGRTGNLSYTAILNPVMIDSRVSRATLHNYDFINKNDIRIGDRVMLYKSGDVIPRIEEVVLSKRGAAVVPYVADTTCPQCGSALNTTGAIWNCAEPACSVSAFIAYAASRKALDIEDLSRARADALVAAKLVNSLSDLFTLTKDQIANTPMLTRDGESIRVDNAGEPIVIGETIAEKIYNNIQGAKNQPLHRVITALGMKDVGERMGKALASAYGSIEALLKADAIDLLQNTKLEAVAHSRSITISQGFAQNKEEILKLQALGVTMIAELPATPVNNYFKGAQVVVTGAIPGLRRDQVKARVESLGGVPRDSVTKNTGILVAGAPTGSKYTKAKALNVPIMTGEEFAALA